MMNLTESADKTKFRSIGGCENLDAWTVERHPQLLKSEFVASTTQYSEDFTIRVTGVVTRDGANNYRADWFGINEKCDVTLLKTDPEFEPDLDYTWFGF